MGRHAGRGGRSRRLDPDGARDFTLPGPGCPAEAAFARRAAELAADHLANGRDVAIEHLWTPPGLALLRERIRGASALRIIRLSCTLHENRRRDRDRHPDSFMGDRVDEMIDALPLLSWPADLVRLDTTGDSVETTLARVNALFGAADCSG